MSRIHEALKQATKGQRTCSARRHRHAAVGRCQAMAITAGSAADWLNLNLVQTSEAPSASPIDLALQTG